MAMRIVERLPQMSGQGLFEPRRDGVLQRLGFGVDFAPIQTEHTREEQFDQAMTSDNAAGLDHTSLSQSSPTAGFMHDPTGLRQAFQHPRNRRRANLKPGGDIGGRNERLIAPPAVDRLSGNLRPPRGMIPPMGFPAPQGNN